MSLEKVFRHELGMKDPKEESAIKLLRSRQAKLLIYVECGHVFA